MSDLWKIERPGARLIAALDSNVLLRNQWNGDYEMDDCSRCHPDCALAWMSREVHDTESASACPASLMPQWAAEVITWMDNVLSAEAWPGLMRRLGLLIDRATPQTWSRRLQAKCCQIAVVEALQHTTDAAVVGVCERVIVLLDRAIAGAEPSADEWQTEIAAANAAGMRSIRAIKATRVTRVTGSAAARAAARAAKSRPRAARAGAAALTAAMSASRARAMWARTAARGRAADKIITSMLDALEKEIALDALEQP